LCDPGFIDFIIKAIHIQLWTLAQVTQQESQRTVIIPTSTLSQIYTTASASPDHCFESLFASILQGFFEQSETFGRRRLEVRQAQDLA
jgi:hypothetical protein